ncbi:MAG: exonuclease domain-containing protein, partial [Alistipes sp.]|nr:exonuclease domain-containing protein [Alistipes sp.]
IKVIDGKECDIFSTFVDPEMKIPERITQITGIDDKMVCDAPVIKDIFPKLTDFLEDYPLLGHNILFDYSFLKTAAVNLGVSFEKQGIDTLKMARRVYAEAESKKLEFLCAYLHIDPGTSHRAYDDARSAKYLYEKMYLKNPDDEGFTKTTPLEFGVKKKSPITPAQLRYLKALLQMHGITPEVVIESLTKSEASRMIDNILSSYGRI